MSEDGICSDVVFDSIEDMNNTDDKDNNNVKKQYDYEYVLTKDFFVEPNFLFTNIYDSCF